MKVVILAGGTGSRISEESHLRPKPMIEIGGQPILWHIMKGYSHWGYHEFIICCGYQAQVIKEYFANYYLHRSDVTFDFSRGNTMTVHNNVAEPWKVTLVDTGQHTMTGGRIRRIQPYVAGETFMMTYGDGVSDLNIRELEAFHRQQGKLATLTAVQPGGRFGALDMDGGAVRFFSEKRREDGGWINGGFMVLEPGIFAYLQGDDTTWEREPLERLSREGELVAYRHRGFWQCMDTLRDKRYLEAQLDPGPAPWQLWERP